MARRSEGFNLSAVIRGYQSSHPSASAKEAMEAIKAANPSQKINEGTFKATFYKLSGSGKRKSVRRRKPERVVMGDNGHAESIIRAGLTFVRLAGGVENARERLVGLQELIETARAVD
jgi:hypothetical protein